MANYKIVADGAVLATVNADFGSDFERALLSLAHMANGIINMPVNTYVTVEDGKVPGGIGGWRTDCWGSMAAGSLVISRWIDLPGTA